MKKSKIAIIVIAIIIIAAIIYFLIKKSKNNNDSASASITPSGSVGGGVTSSVFPLKNGSTGPEVKQLQKYLNQKYNAGLAVDGIWGPKTGTAVTQYLQRDNISFDVYQKWGLASI